MKSKTSYVSQEKKARDEDSESYGQRRGGGGVGKKRKKKEENGGTEQECGDLTEIGSAHLKKRKRKNSESLDKVFRSLCPCCKCQLGAGDFRNGTSARLPAVINKYYLFRYLTFSLVCWLLLAEIPA